MSDFTRAELSLIGEALELKLQQIRRRLKMFGTDPTMLSYFEVELNNAERLMARVKLIDQKEMPL